MPKETPSRAETVDFVAKLLKADKTTPFSEMKKQGKAAGLNVYPLIVGLARKKLGWAPSPKAKSAKAPKAAKSPKAAVSAAGAPMKRGPGRPPKSASAAAAPGAAGALESIVREFETMREALRTIAAVASRF